MIYFNYSDDNAPTLLLSLPQKKELVSVQVFSFLLGPGGGGLKDVIKKIVIGWIAPTYYKKL